MGVPTFYKWLCQKYPKVVVDVIEERMKDEEGNFICEDTSQPNPNGYEFDNLYLDMNGIIHPASHPEDKAAPQTEDDMYLAIFDYINRVFGCVRPRKLLYMAIDGVAPRAKMNQQRSRRFKAARERLQKEEEEKSLRDEWASQGKELPVFDKSKFDSNVITPGTPFMDKLAFFLRFFVAQKVQYDPGWRNIKVILSDASVPGEGEHKIMEFIRLQRTLPEYNPNTKHCIHGLDADLIMLALATHEPHFTILREYVNPTHLTKPKCMICGQPHATEECDLTKDDLKEHKLPDNLDEEKPFQFLHIFILREYLEKEFRLANFPPQTFDLERLIDDFVFLCFFCGNDFLPHLPSLSIREGAIDKLINWYRQIHLEKGFLTNEGEVDLEKVQMLLKSVGEVEDQVFLERLQKQDRNKAQDQQREKDVQAKKASRFRNELSANRDSLSYSDREMKETLDRVTKFHEEKESDSFVLDSSGNGKVRFFTHLLCDELGLKRESIGEGSQRRIKLLPDPLHSTQKKGAGEQFESQLKDKVQKKEESQAEEDQIRLGEEGWKERYYQRKFGFHSSSSSQVRDVVFSYIEGLCWVMKYYYQGCQSWGWYYPFHYAPFASDFEEVEKMEIKFELGEPFLPFEQLMSVFPSSSGHAIPEPLRNLMTDPESDIHEYYPTEFKVDMEGKKFLWQVKPVEETLNEEEKRRNSRSLPHLFVGPLHPACSLFQGQNSPELKAEKTPLDPSSFQEMGGFIMQCDTAVRAGELCKAPDFKGEDERGREMLRPFEMKGGHVFFMDPPKAKHYPTVLPECKMPKAVLSTHDVPQMSGRFRPMRRFGNSSSGDFPAKRFVHGSLGIRNGGGDSGNYPPQRQDGLLASPAMIHPGMNARPPFHHHPSQRSGSYHSAPPQRPPQHQHPRDQYQRDHYPPPHPSSSSHHEPNQQSQSHFPPRHSSSSYESGRYQHSSAHDPHHASERNDDHHHRPEPPRYPPSERTHHTHDYPHHHSAPPPPDRSDQRYPSSSHSHRDHHQQQPSSRYSQQSQPPAGRYSQQPQDHPTGRYSQQPSDQPHSRYNQSSGRYSQQPPQDHPGGRYSQQPQQPTGRYSQQPQDHPGGRYSQQPQDHSTGRYSQQPQQQSTGRYSQQPSYDQPSGRYSQQPPQNQQPPAGRYFQQKPQDHSTGRYSQQPSDQPTAGRYSQPPPHHHQPAPAPPTGRYHTQDHTSGRYSQGTDSQHYKSRVPEDRLGDYEHPPEKRRRTSEGNEIVDPLLSSEMFDPLMAKIQATTRMLQEQKREQ